MSETTFADQANRLVAENQHLRVKSESDDITINLMREQYDALAKTVNDVRRKAAAEVASARNTAEIEITGMMIERDQAVRAYKEIDTTLMQAAELVMQALRAKQGNGVPETIPDTVMPQIQDARLPAIGLQ